MLEERLGVRMAGCLWVRSGWGTASCVGVRGGGVAGWHLWRSVIGGDLFCANCFGTSGGSDGGCVGGSVEEPARTC